MVSNILLGASALLGVGTVPITSALKGEHWPTAVKFGLAVALSALVAGLQTVVTGDVHSLAGFVALWATVVAAGQAFYQSYFNGTTFEAQLAKVGHIASGARKLTDEIAPAVNIVLQGNAKAEDVAKQVEQGIDKVAPKQ